VKKISNTSGDIEYTYSNLDFTITNQAGIDTSYEYNIFGNLIKVVEPGNIETEYSYNALGQLTKVTDADNNERNIVYDISGKRLEIEDLHGVSDTVF
jgi:YD repeat-containing protein